MVFNLLRIDYNSPAWGISLDNEFHGQEMESKRLLAFYYKHIAGHLKHYRETFLFPDGSLGRKIY